MSKEFVWALEVDGEDVVWKCVVHENEVITYEGDAECERLTITNPEKKLGVLQIDTTTKVFDEGLPFQLENGVPFIKMEDGDGRIRWVSSDTTKEERLQARIVQLKKQSYAMAGLGVFFFLFMLGQFLITGSIGEWPAAPILGIFSFACAAMQMIRLKQELEAMGRPFSWKL